MKVQVYIGALIAPRNYDNHWLSNAAGISALQAQLFFHNFMGWFEACLRQEGRLFSG
jgi:hypothetical protein